MDGLQKLTRARAGLVLSAPFYATLALSLKYERRDEVETMATDGVHVFYCEQFVQDCTDAELRGVLCHEVMHVANLHHVRRNGRDAEQWNVACDYAINAPLVAEGFTLPKGALIDPQYDGKSAEQIFAALRQKGQGGAQGGGKPGKGQGAGKPGKGAQGGAQGQGDTFKQPGGIMDAAPASDPAALQAAEMDAKAKVLQAVQAAKAAGKGSAAGDRLADAIKKPVIDWRHVLRRYVDAAARTEYAWHRPNRRHVASGLYLPGKVPDGMARLCVVIDTSGSVDKATLAAFLSELQGACDDAAPDVVDVIQCDTKVTAREQFATGDPVVVQIKGGGGTDLQPALDLCDGASAVVVFTDCQFGRKPKEPGAPVLWARWGGSGKVPAWGELVDLPPA